MTPVQARMARAGLKMSLRDVAAVFGVSAQALGKFERTGDGISADTAQRLERYYREHRIYCGPGQSVSVDQDAIAQERFMVIALHQLLHEAGIHPTSAELLAAYERGQRAYQKETHDEL